MAVNMHEIIALVIMRFRGDYRLFFFNRLIQEAYIEVGKLDGFVVAKCEADGGQCLVIRHKELFNHPPFGMTSRCRIILKENEYVVHILMRKVESSSVTTIDTVLQLCSK